MEALVPQPLFAAALATAKKTIGTPGGFSKSFVVNPTAISMTFENRPSDGQGDPGKAPSSTYPGPEVV
jgi:hypothetical protein